MHWEKNSKKELCLQIKKFCLWMCFKVQYNLILWGGGWGGTFLFEVKMVCDIITGHIFGMNV
jgi:hypothetical protein